MSSVNESSSVTNPTDYSFFLTLLERMVDMAPGINFFHNLFHLKVTKKYVDETSDEELRKSYLSRYFFFIKYQKSSHDIRYTMVPGYKIATTLGSGVCDIYDLFSRIIYPAESITQETPVASVKEKEDEKKAVAPTFEEEVKQAQTVLLNDEASTTDAFTIIHCVPSTPTQEETEKAQSEALKVIMKKDGLRIQSLGKELETNRQYREAHDCYLMGAELFSKVEEKSQEALSAIKDLERMKTILKELLSAGKSLYVKGLDQEKARNFEQALEDFKNAAKLVTKEDDQFIYESIHSHISELTAKLAPPKRSFLDSLREKMSKS